MSDGNRPATELVITAPDPYGSELAYGGRARATIGVLTQIFVESESNVVLTAPFVQSEAVLELGALSQAMRAALTRGVTVDLMSKRENLSHPAFKRLQQDWPRQVRLYHPAFPSAESSAIGSHAKFCIGDRRQVYVGSANLTLPGLGGEDAVGKSGRKHFEMGLLVSGQIAQEIRNFWNYSVHLGIFALQSAAP